MKRNVKGCVYVEGESCTRNTKTCKQAYKTETHYMKTKNMFWMLKSYFYVSSKRFRQMDGTRSCVRLYHNTMCVMWPFSVCVPAFIFITEFFCFSLQTLSSEGLLLICTYWFSLPLGIIAGTKPWHKQSWEWSPLAEVQDACYGRRGDKQLEHQYSPAVRTARREVHRFWWNDG